LALATLAKLKLGRTLAETGIFSGFGDALGEDSVPTWEGGVRALLVRALSDAVRELVRDIGWAGRSFRASRSFSRRSATSFSRDVTSTGLGVETKWPNS